MKVRDYDKMKKVLAFDHKSHSSLCHHSCLLGVERGMLMTVTSAKTL